jgi:preprotein translocase subunit SecG
MQFVLYSLFFIAALLLVLIILLQEGKGGGLSDAFGGAGAETFGVRAGGINRFTFGVFAVFLLSALALHWTSGSSLDNSVLKNALQSDTGTSEQQVNPGEGATGLPGDTGQPPAGLPDNN